MSDLDVWVDAWRVSRSPRMADAIERLAPTYVLDPYATTLAALNKGKSVEHFLTAAAAAAKLAADPRLTVVLMRWLLAPRVTGSSAVPGWKQVFAKLVQLADPRAITPLRGIVEEAPAFLGQAHTAWIQEQAGATADAIAAASKQWKKPTAATVRALTALEGLLTTPHADWFARKHVGATASTAELVARVWAAPEDEALKQVVADALIEQGDAWGELINVQFSATAAAAARAAELIKKVVATVCGPIAKVANVDDRRFAHGFLVDVHVDASMKPRRDWDAALVAPHWAAVRRVGFGTSTPKWFPPALLAQPATRGLLEIAICHYREPMIVLTRATRTAPWVVTGPVPQQGAGWLRMLVWVVAALPAAERARIQIGAMTAGAEVRAAIAEAEARVKPNVRP